MSKFFELCEQYDPIQSESPKMKLAEFLKEKGVGVQLVDGDNMLYIDVGDFTIPVTVEENEEEGEDISSGKEYDIGDEVEKLADKAHSGIRGLTAKGIGTSAQKAKSAVKKRQNVAKKAVDVYDRKTKSLENDLRNVQ